MKMDIQDTSEKELSENSLDGDDTVDSEEVDRDEVKEVRKIASRDTTRIRVWRFVITLVLLLTAFAITFATFTLLKQQENENFETAVSVLPFDLFL